MTTPGPAAFSISLPDGFIELPLDSELTLERLRDLHGDLMRRFGLTAETELDQGHAETVAMLASMGAAAGAGGSLYSAVGLYRSPDDAGRPIMVQVHCFSIESRHTSVHAAIAGLDEVQKHSGALTRDIVDLPAGRCLVTQTREPTTFLVNEEPVPILRHTITAWLPDPGGGGIAVVAVTSANHEDWDHVVDLGIDIFDTIAWEDLDRGAPADPVAADHSAGEPHAHPPAPVPADRPQPAGPAGGAADPPA